LLTENILNQDILANSEVEKTLINLSLKVNDGGEFSVVEINIPNSLEESIPSLNEKITTTINDLPIITPAFKKNAGVLTSVQFQVPILISTVE